MLRYIDTHSHVQFPEVFSDQEDTITRMRAAHVSTIAVGTTFDSSRAAVELAEKERHIFAAIGAHPVDANEPFDAAAFESLITPRVVAIGECGFDYYHTPKAEVFEKQRNSFAAQIECALKYRLPLMLHIRPSRGSEDAHEDAIDLLESYEVHEREELRGTAHFFTGSLDLAQRYFRMGFFISISGVVTFAREYDDVIRLSPRNMLLIETDAPYAAPVPYRGKRNEPTYVVEVAKKIAEIRGEDEAIVADTLFQNACRLFSIQPDSCA